ncbi:MotA/TolQ/ExbB proton channel family protein [Psychrosphaera sp. B3R10]|nr:MotA/TolQ/ExbB proton channel family protein [Psychrosphaera sp. I2R16]MBU2990790.1 MotA/TolQ/ExbB proton channel family protein [Psychrosphaera sp. B3R10]
MLISQIETLMADMSELFIVPVLFLICGMFIYALFELGKFISQSILRRKHSVQYETSLKQGLAKPIAGYPIHNYFIANPQCDEDEVDVFALKQLESLRIVTKLSPMLGLIATMIPMGPALKALADGNIQGISENLIIAFAAVIWGLLVSTITFWPASVKKRWYATELINIRKFRRNDDQVTTNEPEFETELVQGAA